MTAREIISRRGLRDADLRLFRKIAGWRSTALFWARRKPPTPLERLMLWLSLGANMSRIWLAAAAVLFKFGGRSGKRAAIRGVISIGASSVIVNFLIKPLVKRKRPARDRIPAARQLVREPLSTSFPSGHAASAFAFLTGTALESRRTGVLLAPLATGVAYSRTFNGVHYPLDVASGAVIGWAVAIATRVAWPDLPRSEELEVDLPARRSAPASTDGSNVAMIVNPASGSAVDPARPSVAEIRKLLPAAKILELVDGEDPLDAARTAASSAPVVGVCGGDGTVAVTAQTAAEVGKPLLVLPGGTMNHLAHDLGIRRAADAAEALRRGEAAEIDIATIDGQAFLSHASFGAHTRLVDERRKLGRWIGRWPAQVLAAIRTLGRTAPVEVVLNGERRSIWMAFIGSGTYHNAGIAPGWRHSVNDGTLDVRLLDARRHPSRSGAVLALVLGAVRRSRGIDVMRPQRITLHPIDGTIRLTRDGETFEATGTIHAETHHRGLLVYARTAPQLNRVRRRGGCSQPPIKRYLLRCEEGL
jgi:diacylglycerol kinase family enzyme/membrane-associated phospholipid phosphatase